MGDPTTAVIIAGGTAATGAVSWWTGIEPGVAIGAFWGAIFFVLSSKELTVIAKTGFGGVSFFFGIICANWAAELITWGVHKFASGASDAPTAMGAFIAAAVAVQTLMAITTKDFTKALLDRFLAWLKSALVKSDIGGPK
ncbi:phage holin family protein [Klebsiella pneumoniae]|nr:phage holin family protein [Klebsiella pneumoniae]MCL3537637.1 phage holin family protein [Klebsiella pneumoniae]